jgi:hypothetical protein
MAKNRPVPSPAGAVPASGARPLPAAPAAPDAALASARRSRRAAWLVAVAALLLAGALAAVRLRGGGGAADAWLTATCFAGLSELEACYERLGDREGELGAVKNLIALSERQARPGEPALDPARIVDLGTLYARRGILEADLRQVDGSRQSLAEAARLLRAVGWKEEAVTPEALRGYIDRVNAERRAAVAGTNAPPAIPDLGLGPVRARWR